MFFSDRISKLVALKATTEGAGTVIGLTGGPCPAGRVFQYRVGSGRVLDKIPGISFSLGYFQVFWVFRVFSGIFGYFLGISGMLGDTLNFGFTRYIG